MAKRPVKRRGVNLTSITQALLVAERSCVRGAARMLGIPQSVLSRKVRTLEANLGVESFVRHQAGVRLTTAGARFFERMREVISQAENSARNALAAALGVAGRLKIGFLSSIAGGFLRQLLQRHLLEHPNVTIQVFESSPTEHLAQVRSGRLDVAFIIDPTDISDCEALQLWNERLYVAVPSSHSLSRRKQVPWNALRSEQFILRETERGPVLCDRVLANLSGPTHQPTVRKLDVSRETMMHLVAMGFGVSLTSEATVSLRFPGVVFRPIGGGDDLIQFSAVWLPNNPNPALTTFLRLADRLAKKMKQHSNPTARRAGQGHPRSAVSRRLGLSRRARKKARSLDMNRASIGAISFTGSTDRPMSRPRTSA